MVPAHAGTGLICVEERFHCEGFGDIGALLVFGQTFAFAAARRQSGSHPFRKKNSSFPNKSRAS